MFVKGAHIWVHRFGIGNGDDAKLHFVLWSQFEYIVGLLRRNGRVVKRLLSPARDPLQTFAQKKSGPEGPPIL